MPRIYKKKGTRTHDVDEDAMSSAMNDVLNKILSIRKSAQKYGIKPTTLASRLTNFHQKTALVHQDSTIERVFNSKFTSNQVFTTEEEALLNKYITECSKMHYGLTIAHVRKLAYDFAKQNKLRYPPSWDSNGIAGKEWSESFRRRNPNLSLRKPENTSVARSFGFNKTAVNIFFENLEKVLRNYEFSADRIFNFDESGISTVMNTPKVLAEKYQKQIGQIVAQERGELVTFGGIISASGNTIPPLFVFPRVHYKDHFLHGAPEGSLGVATKSGWINSTIFLEVLKHIQKKTSCSKENPILLLGDNHESHFTIAAVDYARENGIVCLSFPPHTTHRLQPLDVGVFGPFKAKLKTAFNDWNVNNPGKTLKYFNVPQLAKIAYFESFNCKNIINAFEKTGIWPFNKLVFSDDEFVPINVYHSDSVNPNISVDNFIADASEDKDVTQPAMSQRSSPVSPSIISQQFDLPSTSTAIGLISPEIIRPYPKVGRNATKKVRKGKEPGKSRIYTDTPEKNRLEEKEKAKEMKKQEQERRLKAKEMKRALKLVADTNIKSKPKKSKPKKSKIIKETDSEDETDISLRESSCSSVEERSDIENETPILTENIQQGSFVLVKFEKKKSVLHYVGQVVTKYSPTEYKVLFLRKKPGTWKFVYPNTTDDGTVYLSDLICILPQSRSTSTSRTANIFSFAKDLSMYNVQ